MGGRNGAVRRSKRASATATAIFTPSVGVVETPEKHDDGDGDVQTPERGKQRRGCDEERAAVIRLLVGTGRMMWHKLHVESNSSRNCTEMSSSNCRAELKLKLQT